MAIPNLSDEQLRIALKELEQAVYNHNQWAETLYGTLICRLRSDDRDVSADAHHKCRFGQWYYKAGNDLLNGHPGFFEIGVEHERMHQYAASLLQLSMDDAPISIRDYERFVTTLKRLQLEISTLQRELETALFNLDPLTGTPSRSGMLSKLREQQEFVRRNRPCVVAMLDLDNFKSVNDKFGHAAGDRILVGLAQYLMTHLRPYDKIFRYGGEEFLICLADMEITAGREIIDRLRYEVGALPFEANGSGILHVTISAGLASLDPEVVVEQSIDRADRALYCAKSKGRNCVVVWNSSMEWEAAPASNTP